MSGWHHRLNGHELEQTLGDGEGQGSLVCCSPWGHKESGSSQQVNKNTEKVLFLKFFKKNYLFFTLQLYKNTEKVLIVFGSYNKHHEDLLQFYFLGCESIPYCFNKSFEQRSLILTKQPIKV